MDRIRSERLAKVERLRALGIELADGFAVSHRLADAAILGDGAEVQVAGRLMAFRGFGKLNFGSLSDQSGRLQVSFEQDALDETAFEVATKLLDVGDFVGVAGELWTSRTGEKTVRARVVTVLAKSYRPLPDKWAGVKDVEIHVRQPYLTMLTDPEARERIRLRADLLRFLRRFLDERDFIEFETPILQPVTSGASARPFVTHHDATGTQVYLRIAVETYLKRLLVAGFDRVYEIGKDFRNEGLDPSHLPEFTMLEWYAAYWTYRDNMTFTQEMIRGAMQELLGTMQITFMDHELDFGAEWPEIDYRDAVADATGIDLAAVRTYDELAPAASGAVPGIEVGQFASYPSLVDALYKRTVRPNLIDPCFLVGHPTELVPLARRNRDDPTKLDIYQVVAGAWELVKGYSELVDAEEQAERMREQAAYRDQGDDEAAMFETSYVEAMEYGMPPNSGVGIGIDRLQAMMTNSPSLRTVVPFPMVRPKE